MSVGLGYLAVVLVFGAIWARMIFALRSGTAFIGYAYGSRTGTYVALAILVVATLVVIVVAFAHAAAALRGRRSGGGL
jgi:hypothetical protein